MAGKLYIPPVDIRRISTGYPPDLDAHWPQTGGDPVDIRRISTGGIYVFPAQENSAKSGDPPGGTLGTRYNHFRLLKNFRGAAKPQNSAP